MADVKWIKLKVGMFDGMSFKKIKKAEIGGVKFRDKLTAVWFELMDFAGRCNHNGAFISPREIPFYEISDIATMIDREEEELRLCLNFFINEGMVSIVDDVYVLSNWSEYQNVDGLEKIKEQNRLRQEKYRQKQKLLLGNVTDNVIVTQDNGTDIEEDKEIEIETEREKKRNRERRKKQNDTLTLFEKIYSEYDFSDSVILKIREWLTYKAERKEDYAEQGLKSLLTQIKKKCAEYSENSVCELIDECMANNWKGIIFDRLKPKSKNKSYDTDEFFEASVSRAWEEAKGSPPKTAGEDEEVRRKAEALKQKLGG